MVDFISTAPRTRVKKTSASVIVKQTALAFCVVFTVVFILSEIYSLASMHH